MVGTDSDARTHSNHDVLFGIVLDLQGRELLAYPLSHCPSNRGIRLGQQDSELLASVAISAVPNADGTEQDATDLPQDLIPRLVSQAVIDVLEVIEVQHGKAAILSA